MNKSELRQAFLVELQRTHQTAYSAAQTAIDSATDEETVPEHKYDTLALEAAYLAHGQAQRVAECEENIRLYSELILREYDEDTPIGMTALIQLENREGKTFWYFIGPSAGGMSVELNGESIAVVTLQAPLGQELKGKYLGDEVFLQAGHQRTEYEIVSLI
ncbi:putative Transcription elongation factor,GreA/GreB [Vibrio nigripulchritudo SFn27]|uniref:Putative Transcription elongation factor, GreA/GreB n=1 Tax=Vibrio nigripulchritudo TaxID=28173 RepID=U4K9I1_9VIBR|nr:transcription elongation factor, GreA/GreB [Vibrio nigripulchritudo]CCN36319.1 putative Transcription elongation factor,GreA/GreB [Vibrio nigripulchritudo AM115]CCN39374.1 putative Transcription elongation factor,GreA/GreB [Vibrio nigripulchritudo FTn2]CCN63529.1 putative Transcription elongation factor,GreA/GreB [Vibrio nigripulchritudo POn4]CCN78055.1 putative Transcription elongation factor,GreA/GreB [Vibrio nigripulchritudo SO65]CCN82213.1 putative Transcription elongation factor,GreA/G